MKLLFALFERGNFFLCCYNYFKKLRNGFLRPDARKTIIEFLDRSELEKTRVTVTQGILNQI